MAVKKNSFLAGPWTIKQAAIDTFMKVTPENRKQAVVQGRIMYVISTSRPMTYKGFFTIDPCLTKGWWKMPFRPFDTGSGHYRVFINEDIVRAKWAKDFNDLITRHVANEELFIKPTDPILKYYKE